MDQNQHQAILKKIQELDDKVNTSTYLLFSYLHALLALLGEKGVTHQEEFQEYLEKYKLELASMMKDAEFLNLMKDFEGDKPQGPGPSEGQP